MAVAAAVAYAGLRVVDRSETDNRRYSKPQIVDFCRHPESAKKAMSEYGRAAKSKTWLYSLTEVFLDAFAE